MSAEKILPCLPSRTYASRDLSRGVRLLPKVIAAERPFIRLNSDFATNFIILDVDQGEGSAYAWERAGLPQPSYVLVNPATANAHFLYQIETVWHRDGDEYSKKAVALLSLIKTTFAVLVGADPEYTGHICKNPLHNHWRRLATGKVYSLTELADYLPADMTRTRAEAAKRAAKTASRETGHSRNCTLFDTVRFAAYREARHFDDYDAFLAWTEARCHEANSGGLPGNEIRATAKSIAKYSWTNRHRLKGAVRLTAEEIKERQQAAGKATAAGRSKTTLDRLTAIVKDLAGAGVAATQGTVAAAAGVSIRTVKRFWSILAGAGGMVTNAPPYQVITPGPGFWVLVSALREMGVNVLTEEGGRAVYVVVGGIARRFPQPLWAEAWRVVDLLGNLPVSARHLAFCSWFQQLIYKPPPPLLL